MKGFFGEVFDLNHDGESSGQELAADFAAFMTLMESEESESDDEESEDHPKMHSYKQRKIFSK